MSLLEIQIIPRAQPSRCPFSTPAEPTKPAELEPQKPESFVTNHTHISHPFSTRKHKHTHIHKHTGKTQKGGAVSESPASTHKHTHTHSHWSEARTMHSEKSMCDSCYFCHAPKTQHLPIRFFAWQTFCGNRSSTLSFFIFLPKTADNHATVNWACNHKVRRQSPQWTIRGSFRRWIDSLLPTNGWSTAGRVCNKDVGIFKEIRQTKRQVK